MLDVENAQNTMFGCAHYVCFTEWLSKGKIKPISCAAILRDMSNVVTELSLASVEIYI